MYEPNLRRILRYAILYHRVFQEPRAGFIAHSAASKLLVTDPETFDALGMMYDESWQAFARVILLCICNNDKIVFTNDKYESDLRRHANFQQPGAQ